MVGCGRWSAGSLAHKQRSQRMIFREAMFEGFDQSRRGNRSGDKRDSHRLKCFGRKRLGRQPGPEAVTIAGHRREAGDAVIAHEIVNLAALDVRAAVIAAAEIRRSPRPATASVNPAGRFCGSARMSSVAAVLPQIFQVACESRRRSRNHAFCSAPRIVCAGWSLRKLGISLPPKRYGRPAASRRCTCGPHRGSPSLLPA